MKLWRPLLLGVAVLFACTSLFALNPNDDDHVSSTGFVVLKGESGKPVRNAAVVLHPVGKHGKQMRSGFELKTDADGKTHFDGIPYGLLRVQVIAHGFQTFGADYQINQPNQEITICLQLPQGQYSVYEKHDTAPRGNGAPNCTKEESGEEQ